MSLNNTPVEHGQVLDVTGDSGMDCTMAELLRAEGLYTWFPTRQYQYPRATSRIRQLKPNMDQAAVVPVREFRFVNPDHLPNPCTSGKNQQIAQNNLQDELSIKINGMSLDGEPHPSSALSSSERKRNSAIADIEAKRRDTSSTNPSRFQELYKRRACRCMRQGELPKTTPEKVEKSGQRPLKLIAAIDAKLRERAERQRSGERFQDCKVCTIKREREERRLRALKLHRLKAYYENEARRLSQQLANLRAALDAKKKEDKVEKLCQRLGNVTIALDAKQKSVPAEQQDDDKLHECRECKKRFRSRATLKLHIMMHREEGMAK